MAAVAPSRSHSVSPCALVPRTGPSDTQNKKPPASFIVDGVTGQTITPGTSAYTQASFTVTPTGSEAVLDITMSCSQGGATNELYVDSISVMAV
ncbi:hypothetical protein BDD12DRAFT_487078 [Trichophaea hybrida]|nr:hypothetical protein BDD12DRAFT_487078 [Trichophaea hybrida]